MNQQMPAAFFSLLSQGQQQQSPPSYQRPPVRVSVALVFLNDLTAKTAKQGLMNGVAIDTMEGQKLCAAEATAQSAACNLLTDYFRGKLKPDLWEKQLLINQQENKGLLNDTSKPGVIIQCVACAPNPPRSSCTLCGGCGQLICFPTS